MAMMLGSFTQGMFSGARDVYGIMDTASQMESRRAQTDALKQKTAQEKEAYEAGKTLAAGGRGTDTSNAGVAIQSQAADTTGAQMPSSGAKPVAPTDFSSLPTPDHMKGLSAISPTLGKDNTTPQPAQESLPTPPIPPTTIPDAAPAPTTSAVPMVSAAPPATPSPTPTPTPAGTGRLLWNSENGLHHAQPNESGITWSADRGLHRTAPEEWQGTPTTPQPSAIPTQMATPANISPARAKRNARAIGNPSPLRTSSNLGGSIASALNIG